MKSGCKPKKTLRMAVGGAFSSPLQDAYDKQAKDFARVPTTTTPVGGDFGPGRNPRDPNNRPVATPGGNELIHTMGPESMARPAVEPMRPGGNELIHTMGPESMARPAVEPMRYETTGGPATTVRPAVGLDHTMGPENMGMRPAVGLDHTMGPENMGMRPAVGLDHTMASTPQQSLRSATAPTLTPSALEQRLNDRMNAGTLTIRGAGMLQGIEDSRRQADVQRYGIDTSADTAKLGYKNQMDIAGMNNQTNIRGQDLNYNLGQQGLKNQWDLGVLGSNTTIRGQDLNYNLGVMGNNTQNSIADKNQQTALANLQNQYDMNQQNINASVFNNLASRSRSFGLRNGGEIHAANGYMHGGFAEQGMGVKFLSPYDKIKTQAELADIDLKQDYMRAQTEALRAQVERADRGPSQDEVNATRLAEDQARRRFLWEGEDRAMRNKMAQAAFDTKMRNDAQDRAMAMQDRDTALRNAQAQQARDNIRYADSLNAAQRAGIAAHNREQDAMGNAWLAKRQAATQDQALIDRRSEDGDAALALGMLRSGGYGLRNGGEIHAVAGFNAQRIIDQGLDIGRGNFDMRRRLQDYNIGMGQQNFDFANRQYADSQARTGRLDEFAKQQYGDTLARTGRLDDFTKQQYADTRIDRFNAIAEEQRRYDAAQRLEAERYGQAQRRADMAESLQFQRDNEAAERAKREESYLNQARADARSRQLEGDFYAREDRTRNYAMLQEANNRLNSARRAPMMPDPRFTDSRGLSRFGLRNGGSLAIDSGIGGVVPGTGKGDKIPAKYEPGEFVVSNDMLKAEPELRDHLRSLREQVLAAKGMTVQEADAKAVGRGRGLRADVGWGRPDPIGYMAAQTSEPIDTEYLPTAEEAQARYKAARDSLAAAEGPSLLSLMPAQSEERQKIARAEADAAAAALASGRFRSTSAPKAEKIADKAVAEAKTKADAATTGYDPAKLAEILGKSERSGPPTPNEFRNSVVSDDDRVESDRMIRGVMSSGVDGTPAADINLRRLNEDPEARDTYNKALGLRGAGIQVMQGENGPVFTNSTEPEKARYTGANGRATNNWSDTQEYKDSIGRTQKTQALADRLERDRVRQGMEQQEANLTDAAMNGDRQAAAMLPGVRSLRGEMMKTEAAERAAMAEQQAAMERAGAPARLKEQERLRNASIMEAAGGDPVKAERLAATIGADTKPYSDMISNAQTRGAHARDQEDKSYDRLAKRVSGLLMPSGDEKADAARQARVANSIVTMHPEIAGMDPDEVQKKLPRLVAEASILDKFDRPSENGWESLAPDFLPGTKPLYAGRKSLPPKEDLVGAKLEAPVSGLRGAFTPGDTEKGNTVLYLPNHRNINLGTLGAEELSFINELVDEANGKPKKRKAQ